ncbi:unannotated protein [freshwater metagenome]|uniref:Unannotated protein n=1 Tax=freshwater metagenome TaxID=449393 RepID=A0A6J6U723_9ZZZZ|nr:hypothetical protein [Actinomycetota bacterium]
MLISLLVIILSLVSAIYVAKRIMKLPSRYSRNSRTPRAQSPWSALDEGIDPTHNEKS